ncbi:hypothetical protein SDC9_166406 [bioreactor metagenome]|uniref:Uncharacterized protein n=1 Tax=bioreactor metagenome TaxID=1076179 RepID=A0A645FZH3_9ZZZZ
MGIRHAQNRRKAARRRSASTADNILFIFIAGVAQMAVQIDQAGQQKYAVSVNHFAFAG